MLPTVHGAGSLVGSCSEILVHCKGSENFVLLREAGVDVFSVAELGGGHGGEVGRHVQHLKKLPGATERNRFGLKACSPVHRNHFACAAVVPQSCVRQLEKPKETTLT